MLLLSSGRKVTNTLLQTVCKSKRQSLPIRKLCHYHIFNLLEKRCFTYFSNYCLLQFGQMPFII